MITPANNSRIIRPFPKSPQERALSISIHELLFGGARGGGKTDAGIMRCLRHRLIPRFRGLVIRRNYSDLCDWIDRANQIFSIVGAKKSGGDFVFPSGATIRTGHLKDADAYTKYQGHEYQLMVIEELTQIPKEEYYQKLISSCRSTIPEVKPEIFCTCNPGGVGHSWVKKRFVSPSTPGVAFLADGNYRIFIPAKLSDNPVLMQDRSYVLTLKSLPEHTRRAWLDGDWNALEGQYFDDFREVTHVIKPIELKPHWHRFMGIDWGYFPDPYVVLFFAIDEFGTVYLYREMAGNKEIPADVAMAAYKFCPEYRYATGDPSMWAHKDSLDSTAQKMQSNGLDRLEQADNDRINGWTRIHEYLRKNPKTGKPYLQVFSTCRKVIETFPNLIHDERNPEDAIGMDDHWMDALRYFLMSRPSTGKTPEVKPVFASMAEECRYNEKKKMKKTVSLSPDFNDFLS